MPRSSTLPLYDALLDGQLSELLTTWRTEGVSIQEMTWRLRERMADHPEIAPVGPDTIRRWIRQLKIAEPAA